MASPSEAVRKATTFFLAVFLWLHALFFLNVEPSVVSKSADFLQLSTSEGLLFALLVIFSFLAASGFWKTLLSLGYIYCFPIVLLGYLFYWCFLILRTLTDG